MQEQECSRILTRYELRQSLAIRLARAKPESVVVEKLVERGFDSLAAAEFPLGQLAEQGFQAAVSVLARGVDRGSETVPMNIEVNKNGMNVEWKEAADVRP